MDRVPASGMIFVLLWMLLPAAAIFLSIFAGILALLLNRHRFSLAAAFGSLVVYAVLAMQINLIGTTAPHDVEVLNSGL
jgi:ATP/ADP translocase